MIESINDYRREQSELLIGDFNADTFKPSETGFFCGSAPDRWGARRAASLSCAILLRKSRITRRFAGHPHRGASGSGPGQRLRSTNSWRRTTCSTFALQCEDDAEILQKFLAAPLSAELQENLRVFLAEVTYPLAVRSSSLLEDSQYQPFTGVYETFMLGNQQAAPRSAARRN